jgi:PAS domain S-box-containing protein
MEPDGVSRSRFILEAARTIGAKLSTDEVLQRLMNLTRQYFKPDAVSVASVEPDGSTVFRAASGEQAEQVTGLQMPPGVGVVGWVAENGEWLWIPDTYEDQRFYSGVDERTEFHTEAILAVPVKMEDTTLAVVELINPPSNINLEESEEMLRALSALAAPAIQNARLFEQVERAEARYETLFERNLDPIVILGTDGHVLQMNRAAQRVLDFSDAETPSQVLEQLGIQADRFDNLKIRVHKQRSETWEYSLDGMDPRVLEVEFFHLPDYGASGAYQWTAHDVTDRVELEETRQQLSHMLVHDLRAPLSSIVSSIDLVLVAWREKDMTLPIEQVLGISLRSAHRMETLINDILDTAKLRAGEQTLTIAEFEVSSLVRDAVEAVSASARRRDQNLQMRVGPDVSTIDGDRDLLLRVLTNLLDNAVKYTQKGGRIEVRVRENPDSVEFTVADDGPGIPAEDHERIFDPYVRGRSQKIHGAGIGLAFCRLAVEAHGGSITLTSEVGEGSTFGFTIPKDLPATVIDTQEYLE